MSKIKTAATYLAIMLSCFAGFLLIGYYATPDDMIQEDSSSEVFQIETQSFSDTSALTYAEPLSMNVSAPVQQKSLKKTSLLKAMSTKISEFCSKTFSAESPETATTTTATTMPVQEVIAETETTTVTVTEEIPVEAVQPAETVIVADKLSYLQPAETQPVVTEAVIIIETTTTVAETAPPVIETTPAVEETFYEEPVYDDYTLPTYSYYVSDSDFILLCNAVAHEAGSDWIDVYSKANVVEVIMNRVNSPLYPNTVYGVLSQPYQFEGSGCYVNLTGYSYEVTDSVIQAVNLYFNEPYSFMQGYFSFYGDGFQNYFS